MFGIQDASMTSFDLMDSLYLGKYLLEVLITITFLLRKDGDSFKSRVYIRKRGEKRKS